MREKKKIITNSFREHLKLDSKIKRNISKNKTLSAVFIKQLIV